MPVLLQVSAVDSLEGPLRQVEGLSDLRLELHSKKMNLHFVLIDELHRHLYIKSTSRVRQWNKDNMRTRYCDICDTHLDMLSKYEIFCMLLLLITSALLRSKVLLLFVAVN